MQKTTQTPCWKSAANNRPVHISTVFSVFSGLPSSLKHHKTPVIAAAASRYSNSFEGALIASTNAGGENVARGAVLGALLGADVGVRLASPCFACLLACWPA